MKIGKYLPEYTWQSLRKKSEFSEIQNYQALVLFANEKAYISYVQALLQRIAIIHAFFINTFHLQFWLLILTVHHVHVSYSILFHFLLRKVLERLFLVVEKTAGSDKNKMTISPPTHTLVLVR